MSNFKKSLRSLFLIVLGIVFAIGVNIALAVWTGPSQNPPEGNVAEPFNVSSNTQILQGSKTIQGNQITDILYLGLGTAINGILGVNGITQFFSVPISAIFDGNVGIGTVNPQAKLDVAGNVNVAGDAKISQGLQVGNTSNAIAGTIRWTGSDFEGYDGSAWKSLTSGDTTIITSDVTDCNNLGGNWMEAQGVCYLPVAGGCPSGWTQKENYSTTQGNTCAGKSCVGIYGNNIYGTSCSTGSHFRTNKDKEDCVYMSINEFGSKYGICFPNNIECLATQTEVGCVKTE